MRVPSHPTLIQRMLEARLKRLTPKGPFVLGSLSEVWRRCGKPTCRCHHDGPLHRAYQLTFSDRGHASCVYVPHDLLPQVRAWLIEHRRLKDLLQEIHRLSVALIRGHVRQRRRKQGRP